MSPSVTSNEITDTDYYELLTAKKKKEALKELHTTPIKHSLKKKKQAKPESISSSL